MKPYFDTNHAVGLLLLLLTIVWLTMEGAKYSQQREHPREGATRVGSVTGWRLSVLGCAIVTNVALYLAPHLVSGAAIRPAAAVAAVGLVVMLAGIVLRGWSFLTLGDYFTFTVQVSDDQKVVNAGPYRLLRHPSYAGILLICIGVGLAGANWASLAVLVLLPLALLLYRIHIEERALLTTLGERYRDYALGRKRLVPLVW
ncbi:MAG TPA: isoprenylcysteine carboxylmethyltransferase family protein [Streptosporangiaceae bacterium]|nr:isoprenylcysteine carboxylmethyltransferase family protein [Streptosporangiaceae bacterium]